MNEENQGFAIVLGVSLIVCIVLFIHSISNDKKYQEMYSEKQDCIKLEDGVYCTTPTIK